MFLRYAESVDCRIILGPYLLRMIHDHVFVSGFLRAVAALCQRNPTFIPSPIQRDFICLLEPGIRNSDPLTMALLLSITQALTPEAGRVVITSWLDMAHREVAKTPPIGFPAGDGEVEIISAVATPKTKTKFGFIEIQTLPDGFDPTHSVAFPSPVDLCSFLPESLALKLGPMAEFVAQDQRLVEMFMDIASEMFSEWDSRLYLVTLVAASEISRFLRSPLSLPTRIASRFFPPDVFNPHLTVFFSDCDFQFVDPFRAASLDIFIADNGEAISALLGN